MKSCAAGLAALVWMLCLPGFCLAHRVNIFAYADGDAMQVECSFSKSQKVRHGKLTFTDSETGALLLEGTTDEQGAFRFRPDADFLKTGHGVAILLNAGEGHQNDWRIAPDEFGALAPPEQAAKPVHAQQADSAHRTTALSSMDKAELEAIVGRVMDARLAPIHQTLARQANDGIALKDIVGGIGWIFGLLGIAMYMKYKP